MLRLQGAGQGMQAQCSPPPGPGGRAARVAAPSAPKRPSRTQPGATTEAGTRPSPASTLPSPSLPSPYQCRLEALPRWQHPPRPLNRKAGPGRHSMWPRLSGPDPERLAPAQKGCGDEVGPWYPRRSVTSSRPCERALGPACSI